MYEKNYLSGQDQESYNIDIGIAAKEKYTQGYEVFPFISFRTKFLFV